MRIETLPADQQEPARKEWEKVLRPFKCREPYRPIDPTGGRCGFLVSYAPMIRLFVETLLKYFFLMTPFFALSMFLAMTPDYTSAERGRLANRVILAAFIITVVIFLCGRYIFQVLGISVDAFRIGAGALLFLSAVSLMNPKVTPTAQEAGADIAVVPLAMPVIIGPATCGPLMVLGVDLVDWPSRGVALAAMTVSLAVLWGMLRLGSWIEGLLGRKGLSILMRMTGLVLSALSAQMIMTGVVTFLRRP